MNGYWNFCEPDEDGAITVPARSAQRVHDMLDNHVNQVGLVLSDLPDDVVEASDRRADTTVIDNLLELVEENDARFATIRTSWAWLRQTMTVEEALAWLGDFE